jgi:hypothetical protein
VCASSSFLIKIIFLIHFVSSLTDKERLKRDQTREIDQRKIEERSDKRD